MALHRDIHWIGRQWAVTGYGMQLIDQKLKGFFDIEAVNLWDDGLIEAMHAKEWLNKDDFDKGLAIARKRYPGPSGTVTPPPGERVLPASANTKMAPPPPVPGIDGRDRQKPDPRAQVTRIEERPVPTPVNGEVAALLQVLTPEAPKLRKPDPIASAAKIQPLPAPVNGQVAALPKLSKPEQPKFQKLDPIVATSPNTGEKQAAPFRL